MDIRVVHNHGHYDVYIDGDFICSADTLDEAHFEVKEWLENHR